MYVYTPLQGEMYVCICVPVWVGGRGWVGYDVLLHI